MTDKRRPALIICAVIAVLVVLPAIFSSSAYACTTFIVGKDASADGSAYFGRTNDMTDINGVRIATYPAKKGKGTWTYTDTTNGLVAELPVANCQYFCTPAFESFDIGYWGEYGGNEHGVYLTATETLSATDEALAADPYVAAGIAESNITNMVLPYVDSARGAVRWLADLVEEYGSAESNGVVFADGGEIWYMEIYTGHQWIAVRCPDDCYAVIANDGIIGAVDLTDTENVMACATIESLPKEKGFYKEIDGEFNVAATYNTALRDYSQIRIWSGRRWFNPSTAGDYDVKHRYELFVKPESKISLNQLMEFARYRLEDTEYSCDIEGNNYRPVGIERTATSHIAQIRNGKPTVSWIALANPEFSVYMPLYENFDSVPEAFSVDTATYDGSSAYWRFRAVSALATTDRSKYGSLVRDAYSALEKKWIEQEDEMDAAYDAAGRTPQAASELFATVSTEALDAAKTLQNELLTKISTAQVEKSKSYGKDVEKTDNTSSAESGQTASIDNPLTVPLVIVSVVLVAAIIVIVAQRKKMLEK